jgi:hypothetical protein
MAAHAGGFLTGAVMALGVVRRDREDPPSRLRRVSLRLAVLALVVLGVGVSSLRQRADRALEIPEIGSDRRIGDLSLPIPLGFEVNERRVRGVTTLDLEGSPGTPFSVTYKVTEPQGDDAAATRAMETLRSREAPSGPSEWIALSRVGIANHRAVEIIVVAPASMRRAAETLGANLAEKIR